MLINTAVRTRTMKLWIMSTLIYLFRTERTSHIWAFTFNHLKPATGQFVRFFLLHGFYKGQWLMCVAQRFPKVQESKDSITTSQREIHLEEEEDTFVTGKGLLERGSIAVWWGDFLESRYFRSWDWAIPQLTLRNQHIDISIDSTIDTAVESQNLL